MSRRIEASGLPAPVSAALRAYGLYTVSDVLGYTLRDLARYVPNLGERGMMCLGVLAAADHNALGSTWVARRCSTFYRGGGRPAAPPVQLTIKED